MGICCHITGAGSLIGRVNRGVSWNYWFGARIASILSISCCGAANFVKGSKKVPVSLNLLTTVKHSGNKKFRDFLQTKWSE